MVVAATQMVDAPLTVPAFGATLTAIDFVALAVPQLLVMVYFMVADPAATPVTTPVAAFTVATDGVRLLQLPPLMPLLVNVVVEPTHTVEAPLTVPALAAGFTVITLFELNVPQLLVTVYFIVALPAATPVTKPVVAFTVATDGVRLLQVPPLVPLLEYVVVNPTQIVEAPLTVPAFRAAFIVTIAEPAALVHPPTVLVTVYVPAVVTVIEAVFAPLLHNIVPPVGIDKIELPQLFATVTAGVAGVAPGAAMPEPAALVHPLTVLVTVYVPAVVTVIEAVFAPLLHAIVPPVGIERIELPQLFTTVTAGVAGVATGAAMPEPAALVHPPNVLVTV